MLVNPPRQRTISVIFHLANPTFVLLAMGIPVAALIFALASGSLLTLKYVHVMSGALWTGIDLFMGFVLGPTLGAMDPKDRVALFKRLTPKMTFFMPVLAGVTATAGISLAQRFGIFSFANHWILLAVVVTALLTIQGYGLLLPNEIRIFQQILSEKPDGAKISRLGMRNAMLGGVQGVFQLVIIFAMVHI